MSKAPDKSRAWRKGWRKRWREGSSFRGLSLAGKVLVHWVEENCDDDGHVVTTMRHLADMMSGDHGKTKVNRMRAWRALQEACAAGILRTEALQEPLQEARQPPTKITRLNFKEYQERYSGSGTGTVTAIVSDAGLSSRGTQKKLLPTEEAGTPPAPPKVSPFKPEFWAVLKHFSCPQLDRADKGQLLQRLKAGESLEDLAVKLVTGFAYGAKTGRGALGFTRQFNDPITRLEMDDVRSAYRRFASQEHRPGVGAGRRAGDSAAQPSAQLGLPQVGAPDAAQLGPVHGPGREAGPVQDDVGVDDGGESRLGWEASLLDRVGDAARADGRDVGLAAGPYPTQEAGGCVEAGRGLDLR